MLQAAQEMQPPSPACLGGRHMQAGGRSPFEHLSSTALLLQKRGGRLGAGSSRWRAKGKSRVPCLLSPVSAAFCCRESAINLQGPAGGEGFSPLYSPRLRACNPPPPSVPTAEPAQPFSAKAKGARSPPLSPHPDSLPAPSGGDRQTHDPAPLRLPTGDPGALPGAALQPHPIGLCSS